MTFASWICRLLARLGYFPKGCPGHPSTIGADKVRITVKQKDR